MGGLRETPTEAVSVIQKHKPLCDIYTNDCTLCHALLLALIINQQCLVNLRL